MDWRKHSRGRNETEEENGMVSCMIKKRGEDLAREESGNFSPCYGIHTQKRGVPSHATTAISYRTHYDDDTGCAPFGKCGNRA